MSKADSLLLEINLLPSDHKTTKLDLSWLSASRVIWPTFIMFVIAIGIFILNLHITETIENLKTSVAQIKEAVQKEKPLLQKIKELETKNAAIEEKSKSLRSIQTNKKRWVILFEYLSTSLPPGMWISNISQTSQNISISGSTWSFSEIAVYMLNLEKKTGIASVELKQVSAAKTDGETVYNFSIDVAFDESLGMDGEGR